MRLVSYMNDGGTRVGAVVDDQVVDLTDRFPTMLELITQAPELQALSDFSGRRPVALVSSVRLLAPIPQPLRHLWAVGWNYLEHFNEGVGKRDDDVADLPAHPTFFTKATRAVIGPTDAISFDAKLSTQLDYEAELVVVIGRAGRSIPADRALDHVFGYTVANDITLRDIQRQHGGQWVKGKSIDGTCPLGPWITTRDEVPDPQSLVLRSEVNGEERQAKTTAAMAFPISRLISELSLGTTLLPGDLILTGTPEGVGYARDPAVWLRPGDRVVTEVIGVGRLENVVEERDLSSYAHGHDVGGGNHAYG